MYASTHVLVPEDSLSELVLRFSSLRDCLFVSVSCLQDTELPYAVQPTLSKWERPVTSFNSHSTNYLTKYSVQWCHAGKRLAALIKRPIFLRVINVLLPPAT